MHVHLEAEDLRPAVVCDDVQNLELTGLKADGSREAESLIRLQNPLAAVITGGRVLQPLRTLLRVEGGGSQRILLKGNDLDLAAAALSVADKVPSDAVREETDTSVNRAR